MRSQQTCDVARRRAKLWQLQGQVSFIYHISSKSMSVRGGYAYQLHATFGKCMRPTICFSSASCQIKGGLLSSALLLHRFETTTFLNISILLTDTHRHTQTHTDTHRHTQTHTDTRRHTHRHTIHTDTQEAHMRVMCARPSANTT